MSGLQARGIAVLLAAIALSGPGRRASAQERELAAARVELDTIEATLTSLSQDVAKADYVDKAGRFDRRLGDAEVLFLLNDWTRAALILYDAVADPEARTYGSYDEALYYLADSLFNMRHDQTARERFEELLRRNDPKFAAIALQRLIQIADRTGRYEGIEALVAAMRAKGTLPSEVAYIWTKSQVLRGNAELARREAQGVPRESRLWAKTRYLAGVAEVQLGRFAEARAIFEELMAIPDSYDEAPSIRDLAAMDRGRLLMEQGEQALSIDSYQHVDRTSPQFDEAVYEAIWSYVRAADVAADDAGRMAEYRKARGALEILLLSETESTLMPEARLLYGNILLRLAQFDDASLAFQDVVTRYRPAMTDLDKLLATDKDPHRYYDELITRAKMGDTALSHLSLTWIRSEGQFQDASRVAADLAQSEVWLREAMHLVDQLLEVLDGSRRSSFFPQIRDRQARASEIEDALTGINSHLLDLHREIVEDLLTPADERELAATLSELASLDREYRALPKRRDEAESRIGERGRVMDEKGREVFRIGFDIEGMRSTLRALNQWYTARSGTMSREERDRTRAAIDKQTAEIDAIEKVQHKLEHDVTNQRQLVTQSTREARENQVRERYESLQRKERDILERATPKLDANHRALGDELAREQERLTRFFAELQNDLGKIDEDVSAKASALRAQVIEERAVLAALAQGGKATHAEAELTIGEVARVAVKGATGKLHDIVLRGDVGVLDVAWQLKEQQTAEINRRVAEQKRELDMLDGEFREVLAQ